MEHTDTKKQPELVYICVGPHCWGRDADPLKAVANAKKHYFQSYGKWCYVLYRCTPETYVDDIWGEVRFPLEGYEPVVVSRKKPMGPVGRHRKR